jgi:kynurenine formamidase
MLPDAIKVLFSRHAWSLHPCAAKYGGSNPAYLTPAAARWLLEGGVQHVCVDLPSFDREARRAARLAQNTHVRSRLRASSRACFALRVL